MIRAEQTSSLHLPSFQAASTGSACPLQVQTRPPRPTAGSQTSVFSWRTKCCNCKLGRSRIRQWIFRNSRTLPRHPLPETCSQARCAWQLSPVRFFRLRGRQGPGRTRVLVQLLMQHLRRKRRQLSMKFVFCVASQLLQSHVILAFKSFLSEHAFGSATRLVLCG